MGLKTIDFYLHERLLLTCVTHVIDALHLWLLVLTGQFVTRLVWKVWKNKSKLEMPRVLLGILHWHSM